ncbi:MAG: hypothetical protein D6761_04265 [Candidatus Dadabacteria bacterium]|nr:MAG: hypothetical protein D6761_04265 [Candidatus Dadabacteria bacterium]
MSEAYTPGMSAAEFFGQKVVELANQKAGQATDAQKAVTHTIAIEIPEAGAWSYTLSGGQVEVAEGIAEGANPVFSIAEQTWRDAMEGLNEVIGDALDIERMLAVDISGVDPELLQLLDGIQGTLQLHVTDADDTKITVRFGGGPAEPTCTMKLAPDTAQAIATGKLQAPAAFMAGQIMIEGDMNLPMQLAGLIPRLMEAAKNM